MPIHDWKMYEGLWQTFHDRFIHAMANVMVDDDLLPEGFTVTLTGRIYLNRQIEPDTVITKDGSTVPGNISAIPTDPPSTLDFVAKSPRFQRTSN